MPIFIGVAEAAALVYATTHAEGRRPSTLGTWKSSLEVGYLYLTYMTSLNVRQQVAAASAFYQQSFSRMVHC